LGLGARLRYRITCCGTKVPSPSYSILDTKTNAVKTRPRPLPVYETKDTGEQSTECLYKEKIKHETTFLTLTENKTVFRYCVSRAGKHRGAVGLDLKGKSPNKVGRGLVKHFEHVFFPDMRYYNSYVAY
jgi:hypothetical protein